MRMSDTGRRTARLSERVARCDADAGQDDRERSDAGLSLAKLARHPEGLATLDALTPCCLPS
jgi:hypothetical protein